MGGARRFLSEALGVLKDVVDNGECGEQDMEYWLSVANYEMERRAIGGKKWLTKEQASELMGISTSTFDRKVHSGELPNGVKKIGKRKLLWKREEIEQHIGR